MPVWTTGVPELYLGRVKGFFVSAITDRNLVSGATVPSFAVGYAIV